MAEGRVAHVRAEELERQLLATRRELEQVSKQLDSQRHALNSLQELYTLRERNRISREIHDAVGHRLSAIVIQLGAFEQVASREHPQLAQLAGNLRSYADESLTDVRQIIADLRSRQEASQIRIRLHWAQTEGTHIVTLRDNGIGTSHIVPHQGLRGIAERIEELGGELDLQSAPGESFFARLILPVPKRDEED